MIPLKVTCPDCSGTGSQNSPLERFLPCLTCKGRGWVHDKKSRIAMKARFLALRTIGNKNRGTT